MDAVSAVSSAADMTAAMASSALSMKIGPATTAAQIDKTAQDFEAMFATQLLQPMFEGIKVDPEFGGGHGEEVMKSFLLQEYGKMIAKSGKLGIASHVKAEMLRAQEGGRAPSSSSSSASSARRGVAAYARPPLPMEASDVAED